MVGERDPQKDSQNDLERTSEWSRGDRGEVTDPLDPDSTISSSGGQPRNPELDALPLVPRHHYDMGLELARGGMGKITKAYDRRLRREVAVKELIRRDPTLLRRFLREISITSRLQHPGIVTIYEAGRWENGKPFLAMRMIPGKSLAHVISNRRMASRLALLPNLTTVVEALAYAHSVGIIHRDLKPDNILIGDFGESVVIDWGLGKSIDEHDSSVDMVLGQLTQDDSILGTPAYMAPEQAQSGVVDERTDVYALGALLYFLLTKRPPYEGPTPTHIVTQLIAGPPRPLSQVQPGVPIELETIVETAMARTPSDRYSSASGLAEELLRFQAGQLVAAHTYTRMDLLRRWALKNQTVIGVVLASMIVLITFGVIGVRRIVQERDRASSAFLRAEAERNIADQRADEITLVQARTWVDRDPAVALAWLKQLPRASTRWRAARLIAAEATSRGIYTLLDGHQDRVWKVGFSSDGSTIASVGDDRTLRLWNRTTGEHVALPGHKGSIRDFDFSPDGLTVATASQDGSVRLWRIDRQENRVLIGHHGFVESVRFSPDGTWLASGSWDQEVRLWDLGTGECHVLAEHGGQVHGVMFSPDSSRLASCGEDGALIMWDVATREPSVALQTVEPLTHLRFSPDGEHLAVSGVEGSMWIWDHATEQVRVIPGHGSGVSALEFDPASTRILTAGLDGNLRVSTLDGAAPHQLQGDPSKAMLSAVFSPDGRRIAAGGVDTSVLIWDLDTDERTVLPRHEGWVLGVAFSPDGERLASGGADGLVLDWSVAATHGKVLRGHTRDVLAIDYSAARDEVASGGLDGELRLWNLEAGTSQVFGGHEGGIRSLAYSNDGHALVSGAGDKTVRVWNLDTGESTVLIGHEAGIEKVAFSPDGKEVASSSLDNTVRVWSLEENRFEVLRGHEGRVSWVEYSPDGDALASAGTDQLVRIWNRRTGESRSLAGHEASVRQVRFSADGLWLASAGSDETVRVWDVQAGTSIVLPDHGGWVRYLVFSPDGKTLATASADHAVRIWDLQTQTARLLQGHTGAVEFVDFSPDGRTLASTSADGTARLWDMETHYSRVLAGHQSAVRLLRFTASGRQMVTASLDGTLRVFADDLPDSVDAFLEWLSSASNARIDSETNQVVYVSPVVPGREAHNTLAPAGDAP